MPEGKPPVITPVLLCGGSGTRLWPLSRQSFPKQFAAVLGKQSLFQNAALRFRGPDFASPLIVTGNDFRFIVTEQLAACGVTPSDILIEPEPKNTGPAALAAALWLTRNDPDGLMLLVPSDHAITDAAAFRATVRRAAVAAGEGQIAAFGITPTRAETGYGWIERGVETHAGVHDLVQFVEKPDAAMAGALLQTGTHLWNAGMFLASARTLIAAFRTHAAHLVDPVERACALAKPDLSFQRLDPAAWAKAATLSIDYAIMEKADNLSVVPFDGGWADLGDWQSVWQETDKDAHGNALTGPALALDCEGSLLRSESADLALVGIGLKNIMAIAMHDAVIVADLSQSQTVRTAVQVLRDRGARQATDFPKAHRPWGWYETLALAERFQVKRIHVHPGASLSLQSHLHRTEHWVVVAGTARVTVDGAVKLLGENQSLYIPLGAVHRLENPGKVPMVLIEVQTGTYLGEDDIIRYDDHYNRL